MALSSVIIQVTGSKTDQVANKLNSLAGVSVQNKNNAQAQIIVLIEAATLEQLETLALEIENTEDVLGVYPVYITRYDEDGDECDGDRQVNI